MPKETLCISDTNFCLTFTVLLHYLAKFEIQNIKFMNGIIIASSNVCQLHFSICA